MKKELAPSDKTFSATNIEKRKANDNERWSRSRAADLFAAVPFGPERPLQAGPVHRRLGRAAALGVGGEGRQTAPGPAARRRQPRVRPKVQAAAGGGQKGLRHQSQHVRRQRHPRRRRFLPGATTALLVAVL